MTGKTIIFFKMYSESNDKLCFYFFSTVDLEIRNIGSLLYNEKSGFYQFKTIVLFLQKGYIRNGDRKTDIVYT